MRAYVDASAAAKLFRDEPESAALTDFLEALTPPVEVISSVLLETELRRIAIREDVPQAHVTQALHRIALIDLTRGHFRSAGMLWGPRLRSLDALHLTSAMQAEADVLVAYDRRLVEAAQTADLPTASPS